MVEFTQLFCRKKSCKFWLISAMHRHLQILLCCTFATFKKVDWVKPEGMGPPEALQIYYN